MGSFWRAFVPACVRDRHAEHGQDEAGLQNAPPAPQLDAQPCKKQEAIETRLPQAEDQPSGGQSFVVKAPQPDQAEIRAEDPMWKTVAPQDFAGQASISRQASNSRSQPWQRPVAAAGDQGLPEDADDEDGIDLKMDPFLTLQRPQQASQQPPQKAHRENTMEFKRIHVQVEQVGQVSGMSNQMLGEMLFPVAAGARAPAQRLVEVQVETVAPAPAPTHEPSPGLSEEGSWRMRHERRDSADQSTALRPRPDPAAPPLQGVLAAPREDVRVLRTQRIAGPPGASGEEVWVCIACVQGEGWLKGCHLKEGGWWMQHKRSDLVITPTALRERPTARAAPLAIRAEPDEEVLVHVQVEVLEGGRRTTWSRIGCRSGEGWLKREHLQEVSAAAHVEEIIPDGASALPDTPRSYVVDEGSPGKTPSGGSPQLVPETTPSLPSAAPRWWSSDAAGDEKLGKESNGSPCGVRARIGTLDFLASSVSNPGVFEKVGFRVSAQLGGFPQEGGPPARFIESGPATQLQDKLTYGRIVTADGRYTSRVAIDFDEAFDIPLAPTLPVPKQLCVDIWQERTSVVDRFDRALGTLGLHNPAGIDRQWLGRAVADLPQDSADDITSTCLVLGGNPTNGPTPKVISLGIEWVMEPLDQD